MAEDNFRNNERNPVDVKRYRDTGKLFSPSAINSFS